MFIPEPEEAVNRIVASLGQPKLIDDVTALLADTTLDYLVNLELSLDDIPPALSTKPVVDVGSRIETRAEGFRYEVAADDATDHHIVTAGGVKLYALGDTANLKQFGCVGNGTTNDQAQMAKAFATGKTVEIPDGSTYRITTGVSMVAGQKFYANNGGKILYDPPATYASAVTAHDNCIIEGVTFVGASAPRTGSGFIRTGAAIGASGKDNVSVANCTFDSFIFDTTNASIVGIENAKGIKVTGCFFTPSNYWGTAISIAYRVADAIVTNNHIYGNVDVGVGIAAVGGEVLGDSLVSNFSHHIITDNVIVANDGNTGSICREGIGVHYNGGLSYAVITGNIITNCTRHGIYMRGSNDLVAETGPNIVTGNIIRFCGGVGTFSSDYSVNSAIKAECSLPSIISDNVIEDCGYDIDGTPRTYNTCGIEVARVARNLSVIGNKISRTKGAGIMIQPTVTANPAFNLDMITVHDNTVIDATIVGILVGTNASPTVVQIGSFSICGNDVTLMASTLYGIGVASKTSTDPMNGRISGNMINGSGVADGRTGIAIDIVKVNCTATENTVKDCLHGIGVGNVSGISYVLGYVPHRYVGENIWIDNNLFVGCTNAYKFDGLSATLMSFVGVSNRYENTTNTVFGSANWGRPAAARRLGVNSSGAEQFEFNFDAAPTGSAYIVGDRIKLRAPTATGATELVCTTAGTPGTWTPDRVVPGVVESFAVERRLGTEAQRDTFSSTLTSADIWKYEWFNIETGEIEVWAAINWIPVQTITNGFDLCVHNYATLLTSTGVTVTGGQTDINGGTNAALVTTITGSSLHRAIRAISSTIAKRSVIAKAGTTPFLAISGEAGPNRMATFNLSTGAIVRQLLGTASITPLKDGWYLCEYTPNLAGIHWSIAVSDVETNLFTGHDTTEVNLYISNARVGGACIGV